jgi:asparagine synthase (glutamine-hydrolysing)
MCGIAGVMTRSGAPPDRALLDRLHAALAHRGPDGSGRHQCDDVGLVHLRLSIVDLRTGAQPLHGSRGSVLIGNGEIYNDPELRRDIPEGILATGSDNEPIVHLYETLGPDFADRLRGMYAVAIHDPAARRLVLARDPFGIKPLYYTQTADCFAFASEPQALLAAGLATAAVAPRARAELLQLKFTTGAETIFPGIFRVLPGETLVIRAGRIEQRRQRAALPQGGPVPVRRGPALARLDQVLGDSVAAHLRADVPYGLFLSGGIDSSALLVLMQRLSPQRVQALTVGYRDAGPEDESHEALRLARLVGADCERLEIGPQDFWTLAPRACACIDDPTADAAVLPTWVLGRGARRAGLTVTLCGEGADELFGGYSRYRKQLAPQRWISGRPRTTGLFGDAPGMAGWRDGIAAAELAAATPGRTPMQQAQAVDCAEWLPNDLLTKLDRCLMVHGIEGRTPFVDPLVAEFAFRLPDRRKAGLRLGKRLLREWLAGAFPQARAGARKRGFKPPVGRWMQARGAELTRLVAAQPGIAECLAPDLVGAAFAGAEAAPQRAWSLLFYALWHSRHVLGVPEEGDIAEVLSASTGGMRAPRARAALTVAG